MRFRTLEGFCISIEDFPSGDKYITFLTEQDIYKLSLKIPKRTFSYNLYTLQTVSKFAVEVFCKKDGVFKIFNVNVIQRFPFIYSNFDLLMGWQIFLAQVATFCKEQKDARLFYKLLDKSVLALESGYQQKAVDIYFQVWSLKIFVFFFFSVKCAKCNSTFKKPPFISDRGFLCSKEHHTVKFIQMSQKAHTYIKKILTNPPLKEIEDRVYKELIEVTRYYRVLHLENELECFKVQKNIVSQLQLYRVYRQ